jgi:hypothetical protein
MVQVREEIPGTHTNHQPTRTMSTTAIIPCCGPKLDGTHIARDLYTSANFKLALAAAERTGDRVLILSAKHGLLELDEKVANYDVTFGKPGAIDPCSLAAQLELMDLAGTDSRITTFLPKRYQAALEAALLITGGTSKALYAGTRGIGDQRGICSAIVKNTTNQKETR